ncbi:MAG: hypothetical protein IKT99_01380, partial [Oscillospiraceae bacterium]|nr:hypothetical protein [Oscillospiraceae bacterium]
MSFRIYNRTNTQHVTLHGAHRRLTVILTRTGYIQLSTPALEYLGLKAGDGIVLLQDERFDDYYFGRGDVTRGAFV